MHKCKCKAILIMLSQHQKWKCFPNKHWEYFQNATLKMLSQSNTGNFFQTQVWESTAIQPEMISQPPLHWICSPNPMKEKFNRNTAGQLWCQSASSPYVPLGISYEFLEKHFLFYSSFQFMTKLMSMLNIVLHIVFSLLSCDEKENSARSFPQYCDMDYQKKFKKN